MLFNSWAFLLFFPIVSAAYFVLPRRFVNLWLLIASYFFYCYWKIEYIVLILFSTALDYVCALAIASSPSPWKRRAALGASLVGNLGLLFVFKYFNFSIALFSDISAFLGAAAAPAYYDIVLPVGISFYTFQTLSYTIDVYRGKMPAEKNPITFALYVTFFPQLVAGPIERAGNLLPQFTGIRSLDYDRIVSGLRQMLWGFFKKIVIADRLALICDRVYSAPSSFHGPSLTAATLAFAFQIYCDFSAYSDIAIGASRVMGFNLMTNFRQPYFSRDIREFWARWHISLSTWFKDYVYIPLGGNRLGEPRRIVNVCIVFLLSGAWHGANTTFIVWGLFHCLLFLFPAPDVPRGRLWTAPAVVAKIAATFTLVNISWIFFRAKSLAEAGLILSRLHTGWRAVLSKDLLLKELWGMSVTAEEALVAAGAVLILLAVDFAIERCKGNPWDGFGRMPAPVRWCAYVALTIVTLNCGVPKEIPFVYFQF